MAKQSNNLVIAILVATFVISGALIYLGTQVGCDKDDIKTAVIEGIADFAENGPPAEEVPVAEDGNIKDIMVDLADDDAMIGDKDAPITIVEFSDYQCPYCSKFFYGAYPDLKEKYVDTGIVKLVFRDLPLSFHEGAYPAALAAECVRDQAGDEAYFQMHDKIFANQSVLSGTPQEIAGSLAVFAGEIGVNLETYNSCIGEDKFSSDIAADVSDAAAIGITGTPSFVVNGNVLVGAQPIEAFAQVIEEELAK